MAPGFLASSLYSRLKIREIGPGKMSKRANETAAADIATEVSKSKENSTVTTVTSRTDWQGTTLADLPLKLPCAAM